MNNNPSKEIFANTGIYDGQKYSNVPYYPDTFSTSPNIGISPSLTAPTPTGSQENNALRTAELSTKTLDSIDDMNVFNNYVHYDPFFTFNPQSTLAAANVTFNIFNLENRS